MTHFRSNYSVQFIPYVNFGYSELYRETKVPHTYLRYTYVNANFILINRHLQVFVLAITIHFYLFISQRMLQGHVL